ncbi:Uncharacterised protein [Bordetella pertussis]|nr:Uncharacterised protein [Bordetella pertussis]
MRVTGASVAASPPPVASTEMVSTSRCTATLSAGTCWRSSSALACPASSSRPASSCAISAASSTCSTVFWRISVWSANPMP